MSVTVVLLGRLGNNLFQYALGRVIAERHQLMLNCARESNSFPVDSTSIIENLHDSFRDVPLFLAGRRAAGPELHLGLVPGKGPRELPLHLNSVLTSRPCSYRLRGYFQRYEYYIDHAEKIKNWYNLDKRPPPITPGVNDVLVNIRRDPDFGYRGWTLPLSYYTNVLAKMKNVTRVFICGTGIDDDVVAHFSTYCPFVIQCDPIGHLRLFSAFRRVVLSNSTFGWWGGFLSGASELYSPRSGDGKTFGFTNWGTVDLHMREPRYIEVNNHRPARFRICLNVLASDVIVSDFSEGVYIERPTGPIAKIETHESNRTFLRWLFSTGGTVWTDEIPPRMIVVDATKLWGQLSVARLVDIGGRYENGD